MLTTVAMAVSVIVYAVRAEERMRSAVELNSERITVLQQTVKELPPEWLKEDIADVRREVEGMRHELQQLRWAIMKGKGGRDPE